MAKRRYEVWKCIFVKGKESNLVFKKTVYFTMRKKKIKDKIVGKKENK